MPIFLKNTQGVSVFEKGADCPKFKCKLTGPL